MNFRIPNSDSVQFYKNYLLNCYSLFRPLPLITIHMRKLVLATTPHFLQFGFAQKITDKKESKIATKFESQQAQDFSVPPPPITTFPAQFPTGNKDFLKKVESNLNKEQLKIDDTNLSTQIILKIDAIGNVINIAMYGPNEIFNEAVQEAAKKTTENIKWEAAKNKEGQKVIDIVRIPFRYKPMNAKSK